MNVCTRRAHDGCMCNSCVPEHGGPKVVTFEQSFLSIVEAKLEFVGLSRRFFMDPSRFGGHIALFCKIINPNPARLPLFFTPFKHFIVL